MVSRVLRCGSGLKHGGHESSRRRRGVSRVLRCGSGLKHVARRWWVLPWVRLPRLTMREWIETFTVS